MKNLTARKIAESGILLAAATVLSLIQIKLPFGGGLTLASMLPIVICSFRWGWKWGTLTAFAYSLIQLLFGLSNVAYANGVLLLALGIILLDYLLAYSVLGLAGLFGKSRKGMFLGILVTFLMRFACHFVSGAWIWDIWMPDEFMGLTMTNPWFYSFLYNGWFMLAEIVLTEAVVMLVYQPLSRFFHGEDLKK